MSPLSPLSPLFQSTLPVRGATCKRDLIKAWNRNFNPRSPCGERRECGDSVSDPIEFQSTLPVRGATSSCFPRHAGTAHFNPRSPCGERRIDSRGYRWIKYFNPRSPCGERLGHQAVPGCRASFQSTLPVRGATLRARANASTFDYFNPRSPCGERPPSRFISAIISSFQSTLPVRGATAA